MKLSEYCKEMKVELPINLIGKIVGKHPNYLSELWRKGEEDRVIEYITKAEVAFMSICGRTSQEICDRYKMRAVMVGYRDDSIAIHLGKDSLREDLLQIVMKIYEGSMRE